MCVVKKSRVTKSHSPHWAAEPQTIARAGLQEAIARTGLQEAIARTGLLEAIARTGLQEP
jgi:hypothetical protein